MSRQAIKKRNSLAYDKIIAREIHEVKDVTLNNVPEGGGHDDQHGEGVLGQGGLWWKRAFSWGEKLKKGFFSAIFFDGSQSSWCKMLIILTTVI